MAYENNQAVHTLPAAADYSSYEAYGMKISAGTFTKCDTLGEFCHGPLAGNPGSGQNATVHMDGIRKVRWGDTVAINDQLTVDATGRFIATTTGNHQVVGRALEVGAVGGIGAAVIYHPGAYSALEGTALANTKILVGSAGGAAAAQTVSGDATLAASGALTVTDVTVGSDAAGDILYKSSATALARLAKGANGAHLAMNAAGTLPCWDDGRIVKADLSGNLATTQITTHLATGAIHAGTTEALHYFMSTDGNRFAYFPLGAGQTIAPVGCIGGVSIAGDETATEGYEVTSHGIGCVKTPFIIGLSPAFYFLCKFSVEDVSGSDDLQVGFRRASIVNAAWDNYLDGVALGWKSSAAAAPLFIQTILNNAATTETDTTQTLADGVLYQAKILVSAAGVVTYQHDAAVTGTLAAPTVTAAFTFDVGDPVIPFFRFLTHADVPGVVKLINWEVGYQ